MLLLFAPTCLELLIDLADASVCEESQESLSPLKQTPDKPTLSCLRNASWWDFDDIFTDVCNGSDEDRQRRAHFSDNKQMRP